jgi:hypothetical protein
LANSIKRSIWQRGKEGTKKKTQIQTKKKEPNVCHKRRTLEQSCSKAPTNHKKHFKKRMELERVESLVEPSSAMIVHFKIEMA